MSKSVIPCETLARMSGKSWALQQTPQKMTHPPHLQRVKRWGFILLNLLLLPGCGSKESSEPVSSEVITPSDDKMIDGLRSNPSLQQLAEQSLESQSSAESIPSTPEIIDTPDADTASAEEGAPSSTLPAIRPTTKAKDLSKTESSVGEDLSAQELIDFLAVTDRDMQDIWGKMQQIEGGREELIRIAKLKLQASKHLRNHSDATETQMSLGARGELQALSHLASFNDTGAAANLKQIAEANLSSADKSLASDSRLVLIGFALENLKQGKKAATESLMELIKAIPKSTASNDVPTLMVLGQARDTLAAYGDQARAGQIREKILDLYQDSSNPELRSAASDLANHVFYDNLETLLTSARAGNDINLDQWNLAAKTLLQQTTDMKCVRYLASAAMQWEGMGRRDMVTATFELLKQSFTDPNTNTSSEVQIAFSAYQARQNIINTEFSFDLPALNQESLDEEDYKGKVILVPFWTVTLPQSLQLMKRLESIRADFPDNVEMLGINLDSDERLLNEFLNQNALPFQNLHAPPAPGKNGLNETAVRFGITSMPFLAIIDKNHRVAAINFTGQGIRNTVVELINGSSTDRVEDNP